MTPSDANPDPTATPRAGRALCPRCGYDLGGAKTAPDGGLTCPECGLRTTWLDLTAPDRVADRWDLESDHAPRLRAAVVTWVRTYFPGWLWSRARLEVPIRPWRLAVFAVLTLLVAHLAVAASVGLAVWRVEASAPATTVPLLASGLITPPPVGRGLTPYEEGELETTLSRSLFLSWAAGSYVITSRSVTHDVDLWAADVGVQIDPAGKAAWVDSVVQARPAILTARQALLDREAAAAGWLAARTPYSSSTLMKIDWWWGRRAPTLFLIPAVAVVLMPLSVLTLRRSMPGPRTLPSHLLRAGVYTLPPVAVGFATCFVIIAMRVIDDVDVVKWLPSPSTLGLALIVLGVWTLLWFLRTWWCFLKRYLRVPHAGLAVLLLAALSLAASLAVCSVLDRQGVIEWSVVLFPRSAFLDP